MTWRQFADNYMHGAEGYLDLWKDDGIDPDDTIEEGFAEDNVDSKELSQRAGIRSALGL